MMIYELLMSQFPLGWARNTLPKLRELICWSKWRQVLRFCYGIRLKAWGVNYNYILFGMSIEPVMSGFLSNFISLESRDKAESPNSKVLKYSQIIFAGMFPGLNMCLHWTWAGYLSRFHCNLNGPAASTMSKRNVMQIYWRTASGNVTQLWNDGKQQM